MWPACVPKPNGAPASCDPPSNTRVHAVAEQFMLNALGRKPAVTPKALQEAFEPYDKWYDEQCDKWVDLNIQRLYGLSAEEGDRIREQDEAQKCLLMRDASQRVEMRQFSYFMETTVFVFCA